jgi:NADH-quinone oxidoreductase subunit N
MMEINIINILNNIINNLTIINICIGISILTIYGLWLSKDREYIDIEIGAILILIISFILSNNLMEKGGIFIIIIINIIGYSIMNKDIDGIKKWELPILKLFIILGYLIIISANNLINLYLGIEAISLTLYLLAGIKIGGKQQEASLKYFILGSLGSGLLLFGMVWIYKDIGSVEYIDIYNILDNPLGINLIIIAILLKMAAAPLHMWAPDVYEGAPTYITFIFALFPKYVYIIILYLLMTNAFSNFITNISEILMISGILSIMIGSIATINQIKFKRFIAYSGIGHTGWIILGLSTNNIIGYIGSIIYILIYIIMNINTFAIILNYTIDNISQLMGLLRSHPIIASILTLNLMSMAGIPPLLGFISKLLILYALFLTNNIIFAIIALIISIIGAFNYIRVIKYMTFITPTYISPDAFTKPITKTLSIILGITSWLLITGIYLTLPIIQIFIIS